MVVAEVVGSKVSPWVPREVSRQQATEEEGEFPEGGCESADLRANAPHQAAWLQRAAACGVKVSGQEMFQGAGQR